MVKEQEFGSSGIRPAEGAKSLRRGGPALRRPGLTEHHFFADRREPEQVDDKNKIILAKGAYLQHYSMVFYYSGFIAQLSSPLMPMRWRSKCVPDG